VTNKGGVTALSPYEREREVPMLLRDPTALLTQLMLLLPLHLEQSKFANIGINKTKTVKIII
jgi:hypothetical protein